MKVYVVYNKTLHLSEQESLDSPEKYRSLCGLTDAHDIREYARNGGTDIYSYAEVSDSVIGSPRFETEICERCFSASSHGNLNEVPFEFRDMFEWHDIDPSYIGSPSSVATDGGEIMEYIEKNTD